MKDGLTYPPVIIIGMHRSGTSMISRMLENLGLFQGKEKEVNYEPFFFQGINDWLLSQCHATWDNPGPIHHLFKNDEARTLAIDYIKYLMKTPHIISFSGWRNYLRYHNPLKFYFPWGWKDPRNTFSLPLWLEIFPDAKVIHIYRHGVDVANSLYVRQQKSFLKSKARFDKFRFTYWIRKKHTGFTNTVRCSTLSGGFSLWEEYLNEAHAHVHNLGSQAIEFKYEDFLAEPQKYLAILASFRNLPAEEKIISELAKQINASRAYAYRNNPKLKAFADQMADRLKIQGY